VSPTTKHSRMANQRRLAQCPRWFLFWTSPSALCQAKRRKHSLPGWICLRAWRWALFFMKQEGQRPYDGELLLLDNIYFTSPGGLSQTNRSHTPLCWESTQWILESAIRGGAIRYNGKKLNTSRKTLIIITLS